MTRVSAPMVNGAHTQVRPYPVAPMVNRAHTQVRPYRVAAMTNGVPTPVWADWMVPKW
jgi:hypothetical protein